MEDRLLRLLDTEQLSSSKFADVIGVQRSSVSHILSGRNKPSFDFLQKTLKAFPHLNADWLILGEGKMYETADRLQGSNQFDQPAAKNNIIDNQQIDTETAATLSAPELDKIENSKLSADKFDSEEKEIESVSLDADPDRGIERVIFFYSDKTFVVYEQGK